MPTFKLNKLIRDKLPSFYESIGQKAKITYLSKDDHTRALIAKITEEVGEIPTDQLSKKKLVEEIADIAQAIDDLLALHGIEKKEITKVRKEKKEYKGGFSRGTYIETLELKENDTWIDYYRAEPDRFPEIK